MIIQGSNQPIVLKGDIDFSAVTELQAVLFFGGDKFKTWGASTALLSDGAIALPLEEAETLNMPCGMGTVEIKWVDAGAVKFSTVASVQVVPRKNKNAFGVAGTTGSDESPINITEEPSAEIIISNANMWYPSVSADGVISWTISKSETAPTPENIKGPRGDTGATGANGADGYTPVRGTDYWTAEDIATIESYVDDAILNGSW